MSVQPISDAVMVDAGTNTRDAEKAVLGACLSDSDVIDDVALTLTSGDFYYPAHELVWNAILRVHGSDAKVDVLSVADALGDDLMRAGGSVFLHEAVQALPIAANATFYADLVKRASYHRRVVTTGRTLASMEETADPLDVVNAARAALDALVEDEGMTSHETDLYAALEVLEDETPFVPTPWTDLTKILGGWRPGALYYLGARPGVGKSVIGVQAAIDVARRGKTAFIASLEMSKTELYHRMLSLVGTVDQGRLQRRTLTKQDWSNLSEAAAHIAQLPLVVDDRGTQRPVDIRARARAIARTQDLGLIVVDYMQLMKGTRKTESRQQEVAEFSRDLKLLAKELQVPIIALSQLNRGSEHRANRMPDMADLRESGALEQDGDAVVLMHRDPEVDDEAQLLVAKNRHGVADKGVILRWEGAYSRAVDAPPAWANRNKHTPDGPPQTEHWLKD